jgi:hypothetical protein
LVIAFPIHPFFPTRIYIGHFPKFHFIFRYWLNIFFHVFNINSNPNDPTQKSNLTISPFKKLSLFQIIWFSFLVWKIETIGLAWLDFSSEFYHKMLDSGTSAIVWNLVSSFFIIVVLGYIVIFAKVLTIYHSWIWSQSLSQPELAFSPHTGSVPLQCLVIGPAIPYLQNRVFR